MNVNSEYQHSHTDPDERPGYDDNRAVLAPYESNDELLSDELARVDLRLKAYLLRQRSASLIRARTTADDEGAFPSACRDVLSHGFRWVDPVVDESCREEIDRLRHSWHAADHAVAERLRATPESQRARMPVWRLSHRFALVSNLREAVPSAATAAPPARETLPLDVLLLALLADRSPRYRAAVAAVSAEDGNVAGGLTADVALQIAQDEADPRRLSWDVIGPNASLVSHGMLDFVGGENAAIPLARRLIRVDERIADFLMGRDTLDPVLVPIGRLVRLRFEWDRLRLDPSTIAALKRLSNLWWKKRGRRTGPGTDAPAWPERVVLFLHGPAGSPFLATVQAFLTPEANGSPPVLVLELPKMIVSSRERWEALVGRCYREASLRGAALFWQGWETLLNAPGVETPGRIEALIAQAELADVPTFIASTVPWDPSGYFRTSGRSFARVELRLPSEETRRSLWKDRLEDLKHPTSRDDTHEKAASLDLLASFAFTEGQIDDALATARGLALVVASPSSGPLPTDEQLFEGCRRVAAQHLVSFAQRISPRAGQDDLDAVIVPADTRQQLEELAQAMQHLHDVHDRLGFEHRLSLGRGLVALFTGPSGTGKTMAATALAGSVKKDLYKVDMAAITSKYVGETEKNLNRVFSDAQDANAVLFFDEADALFGKRGEVEGAQDRWANLEVNFLLQRVEEYTGTVILATNFRQNIDDAFQRRVQTVVSFPLPGPADRIKILKGMFPTAGVASARVVAPPDSELKEIADRFDLSGGSLKNVVLDAVFRAVTAAGSLERPIVVRVEHLVLGVAREYQKLNKPITVAEFGRDWLNLVSRELKFERK